MKKLVQRKLTFLMAVVMLLTSINFSSFAFPDNESVFTTDAEELVIAINYAVESGDFYDYESLGMSSLSADVIDEYESLFKNKDIYFLELEIDYSNALIGTDIIPLYNDTDKELLFLYLNGLDETVEFTVFIGDRKLPRVLVDGFYEMVIDDEMSTPSNATISNAVKHFATESNATKSNADIASSSNIDKEAVTALYEYTLGYLIVNSQLLQKIYSDTLLATPGNATASNAQIMDLTEEEMLAVQLVIDQIDLLPSNDEATVILQEYENSEEWEFYHTYINDISAIAWSAYHAYEQLTEAQKLYVTNYDKLMELSWLWSSSTLDDTFDIVTDLDEQIYAIFIEGQYGFQNMAITNVITSSSGSKRLAGIRHDCGPDSNGNYWIADDSITKWTFTAVTDGSNGQYYIQDENGKYMDFRSYGEAGLSAEAIPTVVYSNGEKYILEQNGMVLNQYGGYRADSFAAYTYNTTDLGNMLWLVEDNTIETVESNPINIDIKLFNYDGSVNNEGLGLKGYKFFNTASGTVDGYVYDTGYNGDPIMLPDLDKNGYPQMQTFTESGTSTGPESMDYLFDDSYQVSSVLSDGGGLFQVDEDGYYYYDSDKNAAYYDKDKESFVLYNAIVRPSHVSNSTGNFLPFNKVSNETVSNASGSKLWTEDGMPFYALSGSGEGATDFLFGMTIEFDFYMPRNGMTKNQDMIFEFNGDDDVFVYVDDKLLLDIGGTHEPRYGSINFATGEVIDHPATEGVRTRQFADIYDSSELNDNGIFSFNSVHHFKMFYLERGGWLAYCHMKLNVPTQKKNTISVTKNLSTDIGEVSDILGNQEFNFQLIDTTTGKSFLPAGMNYEIYNQHGEKVQDSVTSDEGIFKVRKDQTAILKDLPSKEGTYFVRELIKEEFREQFGDVEVDGNISTTIGYVTVEGETFVGVESSQKDIAEGSTSFIYNNSVITNKMVNAQIKKEVSAPITSDNKNYSMYVWIDDVKIPIGTTYSVTEADGITIRNEIVKEEGIISLKQNEIATFSNILMGSSISVQELKRSSKGYTVNYEGTNIEVLTNEYGHYGRQMIGTENNLIVVKNTLIESGYITIEYEIPDSDFFESDGDTIGLFRIYGTDESGKNHVYIVPVNANTEKISIQVPFGEYKIKEIETNRFKLNDITINEIKNDTITVTSEEYMITISSKAQRKHFKKFAHATLKTNQIKDS